MRNSALLFALLGASLLGISDGAAAPKKAAVPGAGKAAPACGAKILPLAVGSVWTYNPVAAPQALPEALARLAPNQPKQIIVTVTSIEKAGADTVVKIEEKHGYDLSKDPKVPKIVEQTVTGTITCNAKGKFDISPELFWFAGEPGGVHGLTFDAFTRKKETSLKLTKGTIGENEWIEEITAQFKRVPTEGTATKLPGGKLEMERRMTPQQPENIVTKMGSYKAEKLGVTTTGRITLDERLAPEGKPCSASMIDPVTKAEKKTPTEACELPANWINQLWLVEGVGVVQALNSYAHMYQLVDAALK